MRNKKKKLFLQKLKRNKNSFCILATRHSKKVLPGEAVNFVLGIPSNIYRLKCFFFEIKNVFSSDGECLQMFL